MDSCAVGSASTAMPRKLVSSSTVEEPFSLDCQVIVCRNLIMKFDKEKIPIRWNDISIPPHYVFCYLSTIYLRPIQFDNSEYWRYIF
ncbi:hypothetical protein RYX36_021191 [Vicia faba]